MTSGNMKKTLRYLQAVDEGGGRCTRMAFYNIAGNEESLRRWEQKLCIDWHILERFEENDRQYYRKTGLGENLHVLLKNYDYIGGMFEELIRDRLKPIWHSTLV